MDWEGGLTRSYINTRNGIEGGLLPCGEGRRVGGLITLPPLVTKCKFREKNVKYLHKGLSINDVMHGGDIIKTLAKWFYFSKFALF